jgi:hypothetical protein
VSPVSRPDEGKVERPVRDVRGNFVYGRTLLHDADLDQQRHHCLERVANVRRHGTTGERPRVRFDRDECVQLQPLASRPYTSLVLDDAVPVSPPRRAPRPVVEVDKRSLTVYARLAGGAV